MKDVWKNCIQDGGIKKMNNGQNKERKKKRTNTIENDNSKK